jgi:hypothetical protein
MAAYLQIVIICWRLSSFSHVSGLNIIKRYEDKIINFSFKRLLNSTRYTLFLFYGTALYADTHVNRFFTIINMVSRIWISPILT